MLSRKTSTQNFRVSVSVRSNDAQVSLAIVIVHNLSRPDPGRREKNNLNFYFHTFFVVSQKVLLQALKTLTF